MYGNQIIKKWFKNKNDSIMRRYLDRKNEVLNDLIGNYPRHSHFKNYIEPFKKVNLDLGNFSTLIM